MDAAAAPTSCGSGWWRRTISEDLRIGPEILKYQAEVYRRLRNTLRYLLGALAGFSRGERVGDGGDAGARALRAASPGGARRAGARRARASYDFHTLFTALHNFCAVDLSAFYFDVRKDALYCDAPDAPRRRAARTVLDRVFDCLARWLAPVLCFTAEEAWLGRHGDGAGSERPSRSLSRACRRAGATPALGAKWARIRDLRRVVTGAIELERAQKRLGSSLQAEVEVFAAPEPMSRRLPGLDLAEICITSAGDDRARRRRPRAPSPCPRCRASASLVALAPGEKCQRCWRVLPEVGAPPAHADLCEPLRRRGRRAWASPRPGRRERCGWASPSPLSSRLIDQLAKAWVLGLFAAEPAARAGCRWRPSSISC